MLDFEAADFRNPDVVGRLSSQDVLASDGNLGHITHFLVAPSTQRAEWALVTGDGGERYAVHAAFMDEDPGTGLIRVDVTHQRVEHTMQVHFADHYSSDELTNIVLGVHSRIGRIGEGDADSGTSLIERLRKFLRDAHIDQSTRPSSEELPADLVQMVRDGVDMKVATGEAPYEVHTLGLPQDKWHEYVTGGATATSGNAWKIPSASGSYTSAGDDPVGLGQPDRYWSSPTTEQWTPDASPEAGAEAGQEAGEDAGPEAEPDATEGTEEGLPRTPVVSGAGGSGEPAENTGPGTADSTDSHPQRAAAGGSSEVSRQLVADLPKVVATGRKFSVEVLVAVDRVGGLPLSSNVRSGTTLTINAIVPESFEAHSDLTQELTVPGKGNSNPMLFSFVPRARGTFPIRFTAYNKGTYVGPLEVQVAVEERTSGTSRINSSQPLADNFNSIDGEASLQITYDRNAKTFSFMFNGPDGYADSAPSMPLLGDIREQVEAIIPELESYATGNVAISEADANQAIKLRGYQLWQQLVPATIQDAIFRDLSKITQLSIRCDREAVPWELLYPMKAPHDEPGFLAALFPVNRWVLRNSWRNLLSLTTPAFVLGQNSPPQASQEVNSIAHTLRVPGDPRSLLTRQQVREALASPDFGALHFACHNTYQAGTGSHIAFPDGAFTPADLALNLSRPLDGRDALVFLNVCRSQGENPVYTSFENWARSFLDLGAAAVIGTSWAVRDKTAQPFAEMVYKQLANNATLGHAVAAARTQASAEPGDPTWLAYTVYGNPNARMGAAA